MTERAITDFYGEYRFLSNFYPCRVSDSKNLTYLSSEAAYQAQKTSDLSIRRRFTRMSARAAKIAGRSLKLPFWWDDHRVTIMDEILHTKFKNGTLHKLLMETGSRELIEGNNWGDRFWGSCNGVGENQLGKLLMKIRAEG